MIKNLLLLSACLIVAQGVLAANPYASLNPQNPGTDNFTLIQQYGFDRAETLDYTMDSDVYNNRKKKEQEKEKENYLNNAESVNMSQDMSGQFTSTQYARPGSNNLHFVRDENGRLRIQRY